MLAWASSSNGRKGYFKNFKVETTTFTERLNGDKVRLLMRFVSTDNYIVLLLRLRFYLHWSNYKSFRQDWSVSGPWLLQKGPRADLVLREQLKSPIWFSWKQQVPCMYSKAGMWSQSWILLRHHYTVRLWRLDVARLPRASWAAYRRPHIWRVRFEARLAKKLSNNRFNSLIKVS